MVLFMLVKLAETRQMYLPNIGTFKSYLSNHFGIGDLDYYIEKISSEDLTRATSIAISTDSKLKRIRTFNGFLVHSYEPVMPYQRQTISANPQSGRFTFIHDYTLFVPDKT